MIEQCEPVKLFWTGGWDSTFRLLQLVLVYKKYLQPYYIIDNNRKSTLYEVRTMTQIRNAIVQKDPSLSKSILPTVFYELNQLSVNHSISESYNRLKRIQPIGIQYEWLALYVHDQNILDVEIGLEHCLRDKDNIVINLIGDDLETFKDDYTGNYRVRRDAHNTDVYRIFGNMRFPLFNFTKKQMHEYSIEMKFDKILELSRFCHKPLSNGKPCGRCVPCRTVVREGLGWRLPCSAKLRYYTWPILRKIANSMHLIPQK